MAAPKDILVKNEITDCAQKLFKQYGLKKTTMEDIALACGKAKSTLYHYFKSKEEVFDEVLNKEMLSLRKLVDENVVLKKSLQDKLSTYFETFHKEAINKLNLLRILKQEIKAELINTSRFSDVIQFETHYVNDILISGYNNGELTNVNVEDIPLFSEVLVVSFLGIVRYTIEKDGEFDVNNFKKVTDLLIPRVFR